MARMLTLDDLAAPALLGAATGLRSQVGVAALLTRGDFTGLPRPWSLLGTRAARSAPAASSSARSRASHSTSERLPAPLVAVGEDALAITLAVIAADSSP